MKMIVKWWMIISLIQMISLRHDERDTDDTVMIRASFSIPQTEIQKEIKPKKFCPEKKSKS